VSPAVRRVRQYFRTRGTPEPQTHRCGRKTLLTQSRKARLLDLLARQPDATLAGLGARFARPTSTQDLWLRRLGWSSKKTRPDVAEQRRRWPQRRASVSAARLVFVDESGVHPQMTRRHGRSPVGQRRVCPVPHGHYQTSTLIAARRLQGPQAPLAG
jgi:hypothetical protein